MKPMNQKSHSMRKNSQKLSKKGRSKGEIFSITIRDNGNLLGSNSKPRSVKISKSSKNSRSPKPKNNSEAKITMNIKKIANRKLGLLKPFSNLSKSGRGSFNIRIDQRFNIQLSPGVSPKNSFFNRNGRLRSRISSSGHKSKLRIPTKSYKSKIIEAEKRVDFVKKRIDSSLNKYYTKKGSNGRKNNIHDNQPKSPMSSNIIRESLRDKRRREITDKKLKVRFFKIFLNLAQKIIDFLRNCPTL